MDGHGVDVGAGPVLSVQQRGVLVNIISREVGWVWVAKNSCRGGFG